jgi:hypothetical protein
MIEEVANEEENDDDDEKKKIKMKNKMFISLEDIKKKTDQFQKIRSAGALLTLRFRIFCIFVAHICPCLQFRVHLVFSLRFPTTPPQFASCAIAKFAKFTHPTGSQIWIRQFRRPPARLRSFNL